MALQPGTTVGQEWTSKAGVTYVWNGQGWVVKTAANAGGSGSTNGHMYYIGGV